MERHQKIILDISMLLIVLTLFNKQLISMMYHEIAGLILAALVLLHIAVNMKTALVMCKKFMKVSAAVKAGLVVDAFLLACFACLGASGVMISRTILTGISSSSMIFKSLHMFTAGLSVILLGVHIGLHMRHIRIPAATAVLISAAILCAGAYGVANSSEIRWLSMPFSAAAQSGGPGRMENRGEHASFSEGEQGHPQNGGSQNRQDTVQRPPKGGENRQMSLPITQRLQSVLMFAGMMLSCTVCTYWVVAVGKKKRSFAVKNVDGPYSGNFTNH